MRSAWLALALALAAAPAHADPSAQDRAKAHFKQGRAFQKVGEYAHAAEEYQAAYQIDPRPEMLFNIAQAYRLGKMPHEALDYFQRYLAAQPDGAGADEARQHVAELTKQIAAEPKPDQDKAPPPVAAEPAPEPARPTPAAVTKSTETSPHGGLRYVGLACAAVGVVGLAAGVKFGLDAHDDARTISDHVGAWTDVERQVYEAGQAARRDMILSYAVGGALVVTGGVLYYLGTRTQVAPVVTAQSATLAIAGRF